MPSSTKDNTIAMTAVPSNPIQKPDLVDVVNSSSPLIALLIALGTLFGLYRKWKATEDKRAETRALLEKKVDDTESAQKQLDGRMTALEDQVHAQQVTIAKIETKMESIVKGNERIESSINRIFDRMDDISSSNTGKR